MDPPASDDGMRGVCVCVCVCVCVYEREGEGERDGGGRKGPWTLGGLICSLIYS